MSRQLHLRSGMRIMFRALVFRDASRMMLFYQQLADADDDKSCRLIANFRFLVGIIGLIYFGERRWRAHDQSDACSSPASRLTVHKIIALNVWTKWNIVN